MQDHTTQDPSMKLCECGCGQPAPIAAYTNVRLGHTKGQPTRFARGHHLAIARPIEERFWEKVDRSDPGGCWVWMASKKYGYGQITIRRGEVKGCHRLSYELAHGPIPDGLHVLHHCDNRACVRPDHLFLGTLADNMEDKVGKQRQARGEQFPTAKFTESDIVEIRRAYAENQSSQSELAKRYNVDQSTISYIITRTHWHHVP